MLINHITYITSHALVSVVITIKALKKKVLVHCIAPSTIGEIIHPYIWDLNFVQLNLFSFMVVQHIVHRMGAYSSSSRQRNDSMEQSRIRTSKEVGAFFIWKQCGKVMFVLSNLNDYDMILQAFFFIFLKSFLLILKYLSL